MRWEAREPAASDIIPQHSPTNLSTDFGDIICLNFRLLGGNGRGASRDGSVVVHTPPPIPLPQGEGEKKGSGWELGQVLPDEIAAYLGDVGVDQSLCDRAGAHP